MMVARFVLEEGFDMEPHVHHNEQISVVVEGRLLFRVGTVGSDDFREEEVTAGQVMQLPPFVPHAARALELLDVVLPRRLAPRIVSLIQPAIDEMLTMWPLPRSIISGTKWLQSRIGASRLSCSRVSQARRGT